MNSGADCWKVFLRIFNDFSLKNSQIKYYSLRMSLYGSWLVRLSLSSRGPEIERSRVSEFALNDLIVPPKKVLFDDLWNFQLLISLCLRKKLRAVDRGAPLFYYSLSSIRT